ncbi:hypothetical protein CBR_g26057 [Chara braunii]|uniref:Uncharacterized protein n=1 Tax=Chara braunii TaxID=69332 RepID=A0A388L729_CHABU|nr:hypothetical protein CBR_g26057 [Chara braunii]|eukprot:GBG78120.1 hypothetical protein CBR_g26057 [Chara braunii]
MEDKDIGSLTKPMIDETTLLDDKQRLKTMEELNQVGRTAEAAYLENSRAREEAQKEVQSHDQGNEAKGMDYTEGGVGSTRADNTATSLKRKARTEESNEISQGEQGEQGSKRAQSEGATATSGTQQTPGKQDQEMESVQEGTGSLTPSDEPMGVSQQADNGQSPSDEQEMEDTGKEEDPSKAGPASPAKEPKRRRERGKDVGTDGLDGNSSEDGWDDEEEEEEEEPETLERWVKCVHALEWERLVECEVRGSPQAPKKFEGSHSSSRGHHHRKPLRHTEKEKEVNEFYATQYGWKAQLRKNDIQVQSGNYNKLFEWPRTYQANGLKRSERKRKAQQEAQQTDKESQSQASTEEETGEEELMEDARRQAVILEAQINVLKDQNRELGEDTTNLDKIAYAPHKEIEAAAKLYARNSPKRRVILPFRWNEEHKDWEVAIPRSLALVTAEEANCFRQSLKGTISEDLPTHTYVLGDWKQEREETQESADTLQATDYRPILFRLQETAKL